MKLQDKIDHLDKGIAHLAEQGWGQGFREDGTVCLFESLLFPESKLNEEEAVYGDGEAMARELHVTAFGTPATHGAIDDEDAGFTPNIVNMVLWNDAYGRTEVEVRDLMLRTLDRLRADQAIEDATAAVRGEVVA